LKVIAMDIFDSDEATCIVLKASGWSEGYSFDPTHWIEELDRRFSQY